MSNTKSRFGTFFALLALLLLAILFYLYASHYFAQQYNPNQDVLMRDESGVQSLVLQQSRDGHYRVSGYINRYPVVFFVDTGASNIALGAALADKIGLHKGYRGQASTANGITTQWTTTIEEINIGGLVMKDVGASILPNMGDEVLLGMTYLRHFHWQREQGKLILTPTKRH